MRLPTRIADEEIGDAREAIDQMVEWGCTRRRIYLKVATTVGWMLLNALRARWSRRSAPSARR